MTTLLLLLYPLIFIGAAQDTCVGGKLTSGDRGIILSQHDYYRSLIAQNSSRVGLSGRNIYAMSYDCALERRAQQVAEKCLKYRSPDADRPDFGENVYQHVSNSPSFSEAVHYAVSSWEFEVSDNRFRGVPGNIYTESMNTEGLFSFAQAVWGSTTRLGCGYADCDTIGIGWLICQYAPKGLNVGQAIVEPGTGCTQDSECTTFPNSTCEVHTRLCQAPISMTTITATTKVPQATMVSSTTMQKPATIVTTPLPTTTVPPTVMAHLSITTTKPSTTTTIPSTVTPQPSTTTTQPATTTTMLQTHWGCTGSPLNNAIRSNIVFKHNLLRSLIATKGNVDGRETRGSNRMSALTYSCAIEQRAQATADTCPEVPLDPVRGKNTKLDLTVPAPDIGTALDNAMNEWRHQVQVFDPNAVLGRHPNTVFTIGHFAQMVFWRTTEVGCGYANCSANKKYIVCAYRLRRPDSGAMYRQVAPNGCLQRLCTKFFRNSTCNRKSGLCELPSP